jgi:cell division protein FtsZ
MLFITVGMGGGTGTGAAPIIAKIAKDLDILTVGIVTIPFSFEGKTRNEQAQKGIDKLRENVDSLVVINNNKLREVYGNLGFKAGFSKADEVLATAATGIAEVITHHYTQNIDLRDAKTVLSNSGTAIMGSSAASGSNRAQTAITKALDSPLLNDNSIEGAKNVLLLIVSGKTEVTIDEIGEINDYIQSEAKSNVDIIMGVGEDDSLEESISVTVIATGFDPEHQNEISKLESKKIIHKLVEDKIVAVQKKEEPVQSSPEVIKHDLSEFEAEEKPAKQQTQPVQVTNDIKVVYEEVNPVVEEEFEITTITPVQETEPEPKIEKQDQISFTFDLPIQNEGQKKELEIQTLEDIDINEIEIIGLEEIKPEPVQKHEPIRYTLEEEFAPELNALRAIPKEKEQVDENLNFELKVRNTEPEKNEETKIIIDEDGDASPLNLTISELRDRADDRRKKMKDFNYKFVNRMNQNIDEIENQPAYKRMGVSLDENTPSSEVNKNQSRMTLGMDDNDDIQFRSNNSFLHDNVD